MGRSRYKYGGGDSSRKIRISKEPDERRQEIVETALKLFSEKGYDETTIQDIAVKLNVSQGLCYRYFKSKSEIFSATSEYYASKAIEQIEIPISQNISATEKFDLVIDRMMEFSIKNHSFESRYSEGSEIRAIMLDNVAAQWVSIMLPIVEQGVNEGVFHCNNIPATTNMLIYGLIHAFHEEMPLENTQEYILAFCNYAKYLSSKLLRD